MTPEARREIIATLIARRKLPTNKQLASKHGVSMVAVKSLIRRRRAASRGERDV